MKKIAPLLFLFLFFGPAAAADLPDSETVLKRMRMNYNAIDDLEVEIKVEVEMPGLRMPRKKIRYFYKAPDKTKIEADGFAVLPKDNILPMMNTLNNDSLKLEVLGSDTVNGHDTWVVTLADSMINRDIILKSWVDQKHGMVLQSTAVWDTTEVMVMTFEYRFVDDVAFVPVSTRIQMHMPPQMRDLQILGRDPLDAKKYRESLKDMDDWVEGEVIMEFSKYRLNQGLPDSFFPEDESEPESAE